MTQATSGSNERQSSRLLSADDAAVCVVGLLVVFDSRIVFAPEARPRRETAADILQID
jgi:hypothetical protein